MKLKEYGTIMGLAIISAVITYFMNHDLGLGPFLANGIVGITAALFLPKALAAATYTASFVGMSADFVLPSISTALLAGVIVGVVIISTKPIFAGWGGKGGTTAALSVILTLFMINFLPFI